MTKFTPEEHGKMVADNFNEQMNSDLIFRLRERARIRRQISTRKSVQEGKPDRIADLLEEAAEALDTSRKRYASGRELYINDVNKLEDENELLENSVLTLDEQNAELIAVLKLVKESIEFHTKPLCMCFAGCDECQPNPQPDSIYEVLETIKEVLEGK